MNPRCMGFFYLRSVSEMKRSLGVFEIESPLVSFTQMSTSNAGRLKTAQVRISAASTGRPPATQSGLNNVL